MNNRSLACVAVLTALGGALSFAALSAGKYHPKKSHPPGCGAQCKLLGAPQGGPGICSALGSTSASANASQTLTILSPGAEESVPQGDLLLAAIVTQGGRNATVEPPPGWAKVPRTGYYNGTNERIQVYFRVAGSMEPPTYSFKLSAPEDMVGALTDFTGAEMRPINASAGEANPTASTSVTAPSITTTSANTLLVFVGGTNAAGTWTAPPGMRLRYSLSSSGTSIGMATQLWPTATATGTRTATISHRLESVGDLIALSYPAPVACPRVQVLTHRAQVTADGLASVRLKCEWSMPCTGAFLGFPFPPVRIALSDRLIASDFTVGAGQTRTVQLALTRSGRTAIARNRTVQTWIWVYVKTPTGRYVYAGGDGGQMTLQRGSR